MEGKRPVATWSLFTELNISEAIAGVIRIQTENRISEIHTQTRVQDGGDSAWWRSGCWQCSKRLEAKRFTNLDR